MARIIDRVNGFVHSIQQLQALSDEACNLRLLSDRALYVLQNLATKDVGFYARYGTILDEGRYDPVRPGTTEASYVDDAQNLIREELQDMTIENALSQIAQAITLLANSQCCPNDGSSGSGETETGGTENIDNGSDSPDTEKWPTYAEYDQDKCNRAAGIINQFQEDINNIETLNWVGILALPIGQALLLLAGALLTPIPGDEIIALLAVLTTLAGGVAPVIAVVKAAIVTVKDDMICDLYNAPDVATAKADARATITTEIEAQSSGAIEVAAKLMAVMFLTNNSLNKLFDPGTTYDYPAHDCTACGQGGTIFWPFDADQEGWTFEDISVNGGSASGSWDAPNQGLKVDFSTDGSPGSTGLGRWKSPEILLPVGTAPKVTIPHTGPSDLLTTALNCRVVFTDDDFETAQILPTGPGTAVFNFTTVKDVKQVWFEIGRTANNITADMIALSVTLQDAGP
jgi:hypothetical protein